MGNALEEKAEAGGLAEAGAAGAAEAAVGVAADARSAEVAAGAAVLEARGVTCGYGSHAVLRDVSLRLAAGQVLCLLGPNGVGKTTLFKTLLGFLKPLGGTVLIQGRDTESWQRKDFARQVAYIPQLHAPTFSYTVHDVVLMGRTPHLSGLSAPSAADDQLASRAIADMGIAHLEGRDYASLSGGERQMVLIARALAQQPRILVMDEPCASLDFGNQARLLGQIRSLADAGMAVVMTTHDPNHAFQLGGDVLCLGRQGVAAAGPARSVLTGEAMRVLYGIDVAVGRINSGAPLSCVPLYSSETGM